MKVHDLKHQLQRISNEDSYKKEIGKILKIYDSNYDTGNEALNIILTQESLICNEKGIIITCMINGKLLNFINEVDLYTLFGNAFDNAIEASQKCEKDKRIISLTSALKGNMISITLQNYFVNKPRINKVGNFISGKVKNGYHGFGVKSIKSIVEKYDGQMEINIEDDIFELSMIFMM